jgi:hypothetical protein
LLETPTGTKISIDGDRVKYDRSPDNVRREDNDMNEIVLHKIVTSANQGSLTLPWSNTYH